MISTSPVAVVAVLESPVMEVHDLDALAAEMPTLDLSRRPTKEEAMAADELIYVLGGSVGITLLENAGRREVSLPAGSLLVVPGGVWHRSNAPEAVTVLVATRAEGNECSLGEDPRGWVRLHSGTQIDYCTVTSMSLSCLPARSLIRRIVIFSLLPLGLLRSAYPVEAPTFSGSRLSSTATIRSRWPRPVWRQICGVVWSTCRASLPANPRRRTRAGGMSWTFRPASGEAGPG